MKVEYPLLPRYRSNPSETDKEKTIALYYGHNNQAGFFPIGVNNAWHGGIHIEDFKTDIRTIADGRIIAYRLPEDYLYEKGSKKNKYSNGFILIQHNIETPRKVKLRFYSLYMHLQPKREMLQSDNIPDFYAQRNLEVIQNDKALGLNVRPYEVKISRKLVEVDNGMYKKVFYKEVDKHGRTKEYMFIPRGSFLTEVENVPQDHWTKNLKGSLKDLYVVCMYQGEKVCANKNYMTPKGDGKWLIRHTANDEDKFTKNPPTGTMLYDSIDGSFESMASPGEQYEYYPTKNDNWVKLKSGKFMLKQSKVHGKKFVECFKNLKSHFKDHIEYNKVVNVDEPIKAGQIIGSPSLYYNSKIEETYTTAHIEVFTDDSNLSKFIENNIDIDRTYYVVAKDKKLQVGKPLSNYLSANAKVKIYQTKGNFTQIGFEDIEKVVIYENNRIEYINEKKYYLIKNFEQVNTEFGNLLPQNSKKLYYVERSKKQADGTFSKTTKKAEELAETKAKKNGEKFVKYRKVKFKHPKDGKRYWIDSDQVKGDVGEWVKLETDIKVVYEKEPGEDTQKTISIKKNTKITKHDDNKDNEGTEWWLVKTLLHEGWIKKSELTEMNPYTWSNYGWEILENIGDQYFYHFNNLEKNTKPHQFIKLIVNQTTDKDFDNMLTNEELRLAMRNKVSLNFISKLIYKHPNEWDTSRNFDKFEREVRGLFEKRNKIVYNSTELENKSAEKTNNSSELENKLCEKIDILEDKILNLSFWDQVQSGDIASGANQKLPANRPSRQFPTDSNVYHFHPIAFVEQMKLITAPTIPPWMEYAFQELNSFKGVRQNESPLKEKIYEYFDSSSYPAGTYKTNWCASFINWCFEQTNKYKKTNPKANVAAFDWLTPSLAKRKRKEVQDLEDVDGWINGELVRNIEDAFLGAVIVFNHSHVAFVVGQSADKKDLIYLGGNQSDGATNDGPGKRTICTNPISKSNINKSFWLSKPKRFKIPSLELPIVSADGGELGYEDTHN